MLPLILRSNICLQTAVLVTSIAYGSQVETFQVPRTHNLQGVMAMAEGHCPLEYALTLVGNNLITDRRTVFRGIPVDPRGTKGDMLTMREVCMMAPFQVYGVEFHTPIDPPPSQAVEVVSLVDSEDDAVVASKGSSSKGSSSKGSSSKGSSSKASSMGSSSNAKDKESTDTRRTQDKGKDSNENGRRVGQVYAAKARIVSRSPSPQVTRRM